MSSNTSEAFNEPPITTFDKFMNIIFNNKVVIGFAASISIIFVLWIFKNIDYNYSDLALISATLTVGLGAMSFSSSTLISNREDLNLKLIRFSQAQRDEYFSLNKEKIEDTISANLKAINAYTKTTVILLGIFKYALTATGMFVVFYFIFNYCAVHECLFCFSV